MADVEHQPDGRLRCKACGGPRLLLSDGRAALSGREREALFQARSAKRRAGIWRALGFGLTGISLIAFALAVALVAFASPGVLFGTLAFTVASVPLMLSLGSFRRSNQYRREHEHALSAAERSAASDLAQASDTELTARQVSEALGIDEQRAELLLAELSLEDFVERRVTGTGELAYSARPKLRVGEEAEELATDTTEAMKREEGAQ